MPTIKTPEQEFIENLEFYFNTKLDDYSRQRILGYLDNYKQQIPPVIHLIKDKRVIIDKSKLPIITREEIKEIAKKFCNVNGITLREFTTKTKHKGTSFIADIRKQFCRHIFENYQCQHRPLQEFLNVDHSSIVYYIQGQKTKRNKDVRS